jgi:hypothetical protein
VSGAEQDFDPLPTWPWRHGDPRGNIPDRRGNAKVGDYVLVFDVNNRVYRTRGGRNNFGGGGPVPRYHYVPMLVTGETSRSWLVGHSINSATKYSKKEPGFFGLLDVDDALWVSNHRHRLSRHLEQIRTPDTLRKVAELIGYQPEPA